MSISARIDTTGFSRALNAYVDGTRTDARKEALVASRIFMRNALAITPPGDGKQAGQRAALTKADQRRGESSVIADLDALFAMVKIKKKRTEQFPDPAAIHRAAFIAGKRPGKRLRNPRGRGNYYHVDARKVVALKKELFGRVGRLAAHWMRAANLVGMTGAPAWVKRHGAIGEGRLENTAAKFRFEAGNTSIPTTILADQERRLAYAAQYTERALYDRLRAVLIRRGQVFNRAA